MKRVFIFMSFHLLVCLSYGQTVFERQYGGSDSDVACKIKRTTDGNYIVAGTTWSYGVGYDDIYVMKVNALGDTLWTNTFGTYKRDAVSDIIETDDGGYLVIGYIVSPSLDWDVLIMKLNASGDSVWANRYGGLNAEMGSSIIKCFDGGYLALARTYSYGEGDGDFYYLRLDENADTIWTKTWGFEYSDYLDCAIQTNDSGFISIGAISLSQYGAWDIVIQKLDKNGNVEWYKQYGEYPGVDDLNDLVETYDGGYIAIGSTESFGAGSTDIYMMKFNSVGDTMWTRTYGNSYWDMGVQILQTGDSGFVFCGQMQSPSTGLRDAVLIKTNSVGDTLWTKHFNPQGSSEFYSIDFGHDGGYIMCGYTGNESNVHTGNVYVVKVNSIGNVGMESLSSAERSILIYPNPASDWLSIDFSEIGASCVQANLFNIEGRLMLSKNENFSQIFISELEPGIYFLNLVFENADPITTKIQIQ